MKKMFKFIYITVLVGIVFSLSSCFFTKVDDNDKVLTEKEVQFSNLSNDYKVEDKNVELYFYENGNVPLIDVITYYKMLDGYYNLSNHSTSVNTLFNKLYVTSNSVSARRTIFDWKNNTVTFKNTLSVFGTNSSSSTDFSSYYDMKLVKGITSLDIEYYLGDYGIDILFYKEKVLMPISIINFLNGGYYNVAYNGDMLYGFYYGDPMDDVYDVSFIGEKVPDDVVVETKNELMFLLNEKYGLKNYYKVSDYRKTLSTEIMNNLSSNDPEIRNNTYIDIVNKVLDDPHSRMMMKSYYSTNTDNLNTAKYHNPDGRRMSLSKTFNELTNYRKESENYQEPIYYKDDTLFITFDSFEVGKKDEIFDSEGKYKEDAYLIDTAALFYKALNDAKNNHSEVKNVVIDVSINGGGYVAAMYRALTFLSDNDIYFAYNLGGDLTEIYNILGDPNMDNNYDDDAFSNYNYYILESNGTFSAANSFTCFAKYSGVAKTIGKRSGGGMCAVMPYILSDGTQFTLSDKTQMQAVRLSHDKYYLYEIESGAPLDIELEYKDFYNLDKIIELIHEQ